MEKTTRAAPRKGKTSSTPTSGSASTASDAVLTQRAIQREQAAAEATASAMRAEPPEKPGIQTSHRVQPSVMPAQEITKPGNEWELELKPRFEAPEYRGSGKLAGKVALITGGDSGIGRSVAVLFAREGADVAILYLCEEADAKATREAVEAEGQSCIAIAGDVRDEAFCQRAVAQVVEELGALDILVNNAAFQSHAQSIDAISEERLDLTMKTNVYGYFHMVKAALPHLRQGSAIINSGSVTGIAGSGHLLDYAATKGAIHAFTKSLASNLIEKGIRVNAVAPGPVWTPLNPADKPAAEVAKFGRDTDMRRAAQPEEISPAYVFLASPCCSSYITGVVLPITGSVGGH